MKRLFLICLILIAAFSFSSCARTGSPTSQNPSTTTECNHDWKRTDNLNESTAVDACSKCGETRLYTDPDSLPIFLFFSGEYTVSTIDRQSVKENCAVQAVLDLFNRLQWENSYFIDDFNYIFTVNGMDIYYSSDSGLIAHDHHARHCYLDDFERLTINSWLETLFTREIHEIKLVQYAWDGYGVSTKTVSNCELTYSIIDSLEAASETGKTVDFISNEIVNEETGELPITPGTKWIEVGNKLYRIDPEIKTLCRMESHLGKGVELTLSEELHTLLWNAWYFHPFDYYSGTYQNETNTLKLDHRYTAASSMQVTIKTVQVEKKTDPNNTITLKLKSPIDQTVRVSLDCYQSGDNLARGDWKEVTLKANQTETVELSFGGWQSYDYWIDLKVDNTLISLKIEP